MPDQGFLDKLQVVPLSTDIDTSKFNCNATIDEFLSGYALECDRKKVTKVVCWMFGDDLAGYVATCMTRVKFDPSQRTGELDITLDSRGTKLKAFPALLIGMLGVCGRYRRKGLGREMVEYAIGMASALSVGTGCRVVTVDSNDTPEAIGLYEQCGFKPSTKKGSRATVEMVYDLL